MDFRAKLTANPRLAELSQLFELDSRDMAQMADRADREFRQHEVRNFATEGAQGGQPWKPLSPAYRIAKARKYPGRKILARTGRLRAGATQKGHADHIARWRLKPRPAIDLGTANPVASYQLDQGRDAMQHTPAQEAAYYVGIREYLAAKLGRVVRALGAWRVR